MDQYRPTRWQILPPVVKNLLIINGIMFLATVVLGDKFGLDLSRYLGLHYFTSEDFEPFQFVTHLFMHGNFMHILSNMFALWMFGNVLENYWGGKRFLTYYFVTGLGAALIHTLFQWYEISQVQASVDLFLQQANPVDFRLLLEKYPGFQLRYDPIAIQDFLAGWTAQPDNPALLNEARDVAYTMVAWKRDAVVVGASGAVFGVLLAFGMLFPNTIIYLYFALPVKAKWFVLFYGLFELYNGVRNNPEDDVAHFAHLGGMLFGYLLIRYWKRNMYHPYNHDF